MAGGFETMILQRTYYTIELAELIAASHKQHKFALTGEKGSKICTSEFWSSVA